MAELFFIATIIFVAYVVFVVLGEKKDSPESEKAKEHKSNLAEHEKVELAAEPVIPVPIVEKTVVKPVRAKTVTVKNEPTKAEPAKTESVMASTPTVDGLKNPKTGEIAKFPSSYNFAKRWIKDALVEEGFLDKVYKNTELDDATNEKIHSALQQLKALDKYR